jgi:GT2 family glycosyltransferase
LQIVKNIGYASAINRGAEAAKGDILYLLNNDAMPDPDCLERLIEPIVSGQADCASAQNSNSSGGQIAGWVYPTTEAH